MMRISCYTYNVQSKKSNVVVNISFGIFLDFIYLLCFFFSSIFRSFDHILHLLSLVALSSLSFNFMFFLTPDVHFRTHRWATEQPTTGCIWNRFKCQNNKLIPWPVIYKLDFNVYEAFVIHIKLISLASAQRGTIESTKNQTEFVVPMEKGLTTHYKILNEEKH